MIIEAQEIDGIIICKQEVELQCSNCGMVVDDVEYNQKTCNDCGEVWDEIKHVAVHATSVPAIGEST
jgi:Zn finger protein HypA/HybF involved in hydrogenase expression